MFFVRVRLGPGASRRRLAGVRGRARRSCGAGCEGVILGQVASRVGRVGVPYFDREAFGREGHGDAREARGEGGS